MALNIGCIMKKIYDRLLIKLVLCFLIFPLFFSCVSRKSITYINNLPAIGLIPLDTLRAPQPIIFINDALEIRVGGESSKTVEFLNSYFGSSGTGGGPGTTGPQFTVDVDGNIELPKLGKVKIAGLTRDKARDTLTILYGQYLTNPIVTVKFSNFRFSVIGEVRSPGSFSIVTDRVNIFEALAQAGDVTPYSRIESVHVIRDMNGKRDIITIDLTNKNILNSQNYYINRNDVVYVESRPLKSITDNFTRTVTFVTAAASVLALILVLKQ